MKGIFTFHYLWIAKNSPVIVVPVYDVPLICSRVSGSLLSKFFIVYTPSRRAGEIVMHVDDILQIRPQNHGLLQILLPNYGCKSVKRVLPLLERQVVGLTPCSPIIIVGCVVPIAYIVISGLKKGKINKFVSPNL
jgi:hypothetical protein